MSCLSVASSDILAACSWIRGRRRSRGTSSISVGFSTSIGVYGGTTTSAWVRSLPINPEFQRERMVLRVLAFISERWSGFSIWWGGLPSR
ncbi:hypothetical protein D3C72_2313870 [compost metagenome]